MKRVPRFTTGTWLTLGTVGLGALLYLGEPLPLQVMRNAVFDQYQRWHPRAYEPLPVRIVDIDDESLKRLGQWPWPRTRIAELIGKLQEAGAAAIGFDVVFAEEDRTSPKAMAGTWSVPQAVRDQLLEIPDHDRVMAEAVRRGAVVLGFAVKREGADGALPARPHARGPP